MSERDSLVHNHANGNNSLQSQPAGAETFFERVIRPCIGEFVGVATFVFIGTMSVAGTGGVLGVAIAHGLMIALMVAALANISGGHLNPAVTVGVLFSGGITPLNSVLYIISQLVGSIFGAALTRGVLSKAAYVNISGGATSLGADTSVSEGLLCEVVLTSILVLTILTTAVDSSTKTSLAPLAIGFAVIVAILAGASISGSSLNPARSLGPAVTVSTFSSGVWDNHWIYWVGPVAGSLLAVLLHRLFLAGPEKRFL